MTELDRVWAETQIEAMADGSLSAAGEQRMRAAMSRDPELAARVGRARALRRELRRCAEVPVPRGLLRRLWKIPAPAGASHGGGFWMPAGVVATIVVAALSVNVFFSQPDVAPMDQAQAAAVQDFTIAVTYLQKSMLMAHNEINEVIGSGMLSALAASSGMMDRTGSNGFEGGRQDDD